MTLVMTAEQELETGTIDMKIKQSKRVVHVGQTGKHERTDPDYEEKRIAKLVKDYHECPDEWVNVFLDGLTSYDRKAIRGFFK